MLVPTSTKRIAFSFSSTPCAPPMGLGSDSTRISDRQRGMTGRRPHAGCQATGTSRGASGARGVYRGESKTHLRGVGGRLPHRVHERPLLIVLPRHVRGFSRRNRGELRVRVRGLRRAAAQSESATGRDGRASTRERRPAPAGEPGDSRPGPKSRADRSSEARDDVGRRKSVRARRIAVHARRNV